MNEKLHTLNHLKKQQRLKIHRGKRLYCYIIMITIIIHYPKKTHLSMINARRERETHIAEAPRRNTRTIIHKHTHTHTHDEYLLTWREWGRGGTPPPPSSLLREWADRVSKGRGFWTNVKDATALPLRNDPTCRSLPFFIRQIHDSCCALVERATVLLAARI